MARFKYGLWLAVLVGCGVAVAGLGRARAEKGEKDKDKLEGTWKVTAAEMDGEAAPDKLIKNARIVFTGDKVVVKGFGEEKEEEASFTTDGSKKPKEITFVPTKGDKKDEKALGIYELDGDTLKICFSKEGAARPTSFQPKKGDKAFVMTLKRDKP